MKNGFLKGLTVLGLVVGGVGFVLVVLGPALVGAAMASLGAWLLGTGVGMLVAALMTAAIVAEIGRAADRVLAGLTQTTHTVRLSESQVNDIGDATATAIGRTQRP